MVRKLNAVCGVIKLENKYFVVRNIDPDEDFNFWEFPSGAAQNGDNPLEDLTRIFKQKLGLKIEKSEPLYKVTHSYSTFDITVHAYLVECDKLPTKVKYTERKQYDSHQYMTYTGGGEAHNNMPPYIVANIWEKTGY